jgi:very-short-patch-repair endonuclease
MRIHRSATLTPHDITVHRSIRRPEANARIEGIEVDFVWRNRRLIVEVDGYRYHRSPTAFEDDRAKDIALAIKDWRVLRFTWRQITARSAWVAAAVAARYRRGP